MVKRGEWFEMDFPALPATSVQTPVGLAAALGVEPRRVQESTNDWLAVLDNFVSRAFPVSARGGEVRCPVAGDRVKLAGHAVAYLEGAISVSSARFRDDR